EELEKSAAAAERAEAREKILSHLVERQPVEVPSALVDVEIDRRLESIVRELIAEGKDPAKLKVNWQEERERLVPAGARSVQAMLIVEAIAQQEGIDASEEDVSGWLREEARRHNITVTALKERLSQNARLAGLRRQIVREKSLDFVMNGATITHEVK